MAVSAPEQRRGVTDTPPADALALLSGVAVALGDGVAADALLAELAAGVRRVLDADRVSVLMLEHDRLTPAIAVARQHDDELWQRFRRMPPIPLPELPGAREVLRSSDIVFIGDASAHPLIPEFWQRQFGLSSLAIAPLHVRGEPAGALVVEHGHSPLFEPRQRTLLEGLAALAGVALNGVRDAAAARTTDGLTALADAIGTARSPRAVAEQALACLLDTVGSAHGLVALYHGDDVEVVAVRGAGLPEPGRYELANVPDDVVDRCRAAWTTDIHALVQASVGGNPLTFVPIASGTTLLAIAVLPAIEPLPRRARSEVLLIASTAALALRAIRIDAQLGWLHRALAAVGSDSRDIEALVVAASGLVSDDGSRLVDVVAADRALARATGLSAPRRELTRQIARWRRSSHQLSPAQVEEGTAVPLVADGRVFGALVVHPVRDAVRLTTAAELLGAAICRCVERQRGDELTRAVAEADAHRLVAARCYTETGQLLGRLNEQLTAAAATDRRTSANARVLVDQACRLVRDAAAALNPGVARQPTLRAALASIAEQVYAQGGPQATVRQIGRMQPLKPATHIAVSHAVRRILGFLRAERAALAVVHLEAVNDEVTVRVRAGDALGVEDVVDGSGLHAMLRDARAWLSPVAGRLEHSVGSGEWRFLLTAPAGVRRPERLTPVRWQEDGGEVVPLQSARPGHS